MINKQNHILAAVPFEARIKGQIGRYARLASGPREEFCKSGASGSGTVGCVRNHIDGILECGFVFFIQKGYERFLVAVRMLLEIELLQVGDTLFVQMAGKISVVQ